MSPTTLYRQFILLEDILCILHLSSTENILFILLGGYSFILHGGYSIYPLWRKFLLSFGKDISFILLEHNSLFILLVDISSFILQSIKKITQAVLWKIDHWSNWSLKRAKTTVAKQRRHTVFASKFFYYNILLEMK